MRPPTAHPPDGPATLRSIADQLGLHVSTVSRVLNGPVDDRRAASAATAERIRRLATELGYHANPHATGLKTQRSKLVGVLVPRLSDIVLATIYEGIDEAAAEHGLSTFVANTRDRPDLQRERLEMVLARRVDGVVLADAHVDGRVADELASRGVPFVLANRAAGDHPAVTCDDRFGGQLAARHLLELGHERLAVVAGEPYASTAIERTAGFLAACRDAGVELPPQRVVASAFDAAGGRAATEALLREGERPTAIFAVNDFAAVGAAGAARDHGLTLGRDISIVGFNDAPLMADLPTPLTTVRSPMHAIGRRAAELLVRRLAGEPIASERLTPSLVVRASTTRA